MRRVASLPGSVGESGLGRKHRVQQRAGLPLDLKLLQLSPGASLVQLAELPSGTRLLHILLLCGSGLMAGLRAVYVSSSISASWSSLAP